MNHAEMLHEWALLGLDLISARRHSVLLWEPVSELIEVVREKLKGDAGRLREALEQSRLRLNPLEDPFDLDLGTHRWLSEEREEAYSDWLQWVLEQFKNPRTILTILYVQAPPDIDRWESEGLTVQREYPIPFGHEGQSGRLDLLVRFGDELLIAIEVKKVGAEDSDTAKHTGYSLWLSQQMKHYKHGAIGKFLAVDQLEGADYGFPFLSWADICVELRRATPLLCRDKKLLTASMVLAFVAAVEQNLLGFSVGLVRNVCRGHSILFNTAVIDHLEKSSS